MPKFRAKRVFHGVSLILGLLLIVLLYSPVRSGLVKLLILAGVLAVILVPLTLLPRMARILALVGLGLFVGWLSFQSSEQPNSDRLRGSYAELLRRYEGVPYVWGGENHRGIDCSGLVRAAWIEAKVREGISSRNCNMLAKGFDIWWHDSSAKELASGYSGRTQVLGRDRSIRAHNDEGLQPGDFAIVAKGVHALAYLGEHQWIEADPGAGKVIVIATTNSHPWLEADAVFVRWTELNPEVAQRTRQN